MGEQGWKDKTPSIYRKVNEKTNLLKKVKTFAQKGKKCKKALYTPKKGTRKQKAFKF